MIFDSTLKQQIMFKHIRLVKQASEYGQNTKQYNVQYSAMSNRKKDLCFSLVYDHV